MSERNQPSATVIDRLLESLHTMLPAPAAPATAMSALPAVLDRAIEVEAHEQLTELTRAFPGTYALFYMLGCDAEATGDFAAAEHHFARAASLLAHLENRLPAEDALLASLS